MILADKRRRAGWRVKLFNFPREIHHEETPLHPRAHSAAAFAVCGPVFAQVAGSSTTTGISVVESAQVALGWIVKKTLLGKTIYNESGQKVGNVQDISIAPDRSVSYAIVGAGGFIGMGRHDVAIPVTQIQDQTGKLVMVGATVDLIKSTPQFDYANDKRAVIAALDQIDEMLARRGGTQISTPGEFSCPK